MSNFASKNLTHGETNALVKLVGGETQVRKILAGELKIQLLPTTDEVAMVPTDAGRFLTVDPDLTFEDRIARGNYYWCHNDLTEKQFPVTEDQYGKWRWKRFRFHRRISSAAAIRLMKENGYDAAQIGHIFAFGEKYPEEQRLYPIAALGSVYLVDAYHRIPELGGGGGQRTLSLKKLNSDWDDFYCFLGVRRPLGYLDSSGI